MALYVGQLQKFPVFANPATPFTPFILILAITDTDSSPLFLIPTQWILVTLIHFNFVLARIRDAKSGQFSP